MERTLIAALVTSTIVVAAVAATYSPARAAGILQLIVNQNSAAGGRLAAPQPSVQPATPLQFGNGAAPQQATGAGDGRDFLTWQKNFGN